MIFKYLLRAYTATTKPIMSSSSSSSSFVTKVLKVDPKNIDFTKEGIPQIADPETLQNLKTAAHELTTTNNVIGFPTETVYGLAGSALSDESVRSIYRAKNRPADNPLIVHISSLDQLNRKLIPNQSIPKIYNKLIEKFWPGPLTILLPISSNNATISSLVTANQDTFAVRMPKHPVARALIALSDLPIAAPSANASTRPSPTLAEHVYHDLQGKIPIILDGGPCEVGLESTVVDGLSDPPMLLRPGGISLEEIKEFGGEEWKNIVVAKKTAGKLEPVKTPGMKYRHYSPSAKVVLFVNCGDGKLAIKEYLKKNNIDTSKTKIAILKSKNFGNITIEHSKEKEGSSGIDSSFTIVKELGNTGNEISYNLFKYLREVDEVDKVDLIFVEGIDESNEGLAVMNRLSKAAMEVINPIA